MPPPLYFAVQNTEEEFKSNPPFIADLIISFYCFCFDPLALRVLPLIFPYGNTGGEVEMYSAFAPYTDFISDTEEEG